MPADDQPIRTDPARDVHENETVIPSPGADFDANRGQEDASPASGGVADLAEFSHALVEIGLIDASDLEPFAADSSEGVLGLSRALVKAGKLTPYQAAAVYQKKSRGLLIGNYLILEKLGQGGMGVVFKARHRRLGRVGALKILPPSFARDKDAVMRFRREVEAAGRLKHANLVAAQDADEDRGVHFLVMDYVEGRDLDRVVRERGPLPVAQAVDCLIQAARGLEAAHAQGIIHRDIKPGNLMLDPAGTVRVLDLGLARIVDAGNPFGKSTAGRLTQSGMYMGTVDYMAPEQAEDSHRVDHRADIYSLGCTLYYVLTGREPFLGATVLKRLMAHMERPAPSLRVARPDVPQALDAVYLRMMAKRPEERPASMTEVIALLEACKGAATEAKAAAGEAPKSRPELMVFNEAPLKRVGAPRTKAEPSIFAHREEPAELRIGQELRLEDLVMDVRPEVRPEPLPAASKRPAQQDPALRRQVTAKARHRPRRRLGAAVLALGAMLALGVALARFRLFRGAAPRKEAAPLAVVNRPNVNRDGAIRETEPARPKPPSIKPSSPATPPPPAPEPEPYVETAQFVGHAHRWVEAIRLLPDGKRLVTTSGDKTARLWDIATGREIRRFWHPERVLPIALVPPDGRRAVTGCVDGVVRLWDLESGKLIRTLATHSKPVWGVAISPDGRVAVSGGEDRILRLSDVENGSSMGQLECPVEKICSVAISPDGRRAIAGGTDGLWLGEMPGSAPMQPLAADSKKSIREVAFAGDSRHAVSANVGGLTYWDLDTARAVHEAKVEGDMIRSLAVETDGRRLVFGAQRGENLNEADGFLGFWDFAARGESRRGPSGFAHLGLTLLSRGGIATADIEGIARIWEPSASIATARELRKAGKEFDALGRYDKAVAGRPVDARLLIERGRLLARLGQSAKADADFERAAQLAPESPQLFVDAGWWVAGPYPGDLDQRFDIETALVPEPSKPAPASGSEERLWRELPIGMQGGVDLGAVFKGDHIAAYALTFIYSSSPRDVVLLVGIDDYSLVLLNGREILRVEGYTEPDSRAVPVTLQSGRNTILAKIVNYAQGYSLHLHIGDSPADFARGYAQTKKWDQAYDAYTKALALEPENGDWRLHWEVGIAMAEAGRWKEAKGAFERLVALQPGDWGRQFQLAECYLALRDFASYRRLCEAAIKQHGKDRGLANNLAWQVALIPNAVRNYTEVVEIDRKVMNTRAGAEWTLLNTYGAILYRAGQYRLAIVNLDRSIKAQKGNGNAFDWVFMAMARHKFRQPGDREALEQARALSKSGSMSWEHRVEISALLEEAKRELDLPPPLH
jgi:serine/threonine protein kinase/WD40 repeat protein/tetratricopeptide (TPR) repeat protein